MIQIATIDTIFDITKEGSVDGWFIVDDRVMGGRSNGHFDLTDDNYGRFWGDVSTENNGGFSSVRYRVEDAKTMLAEAFVLKIKGDGRQYQFRVKSNKSERFSYVTEFETSGEWEEITISFDTMRPQWRGSRLSGANYDGDGLSEIGFLVGNKRNESFELQIKSLQIK